MKNTILCSAFPGVGKTYLYKNPGHLVVLDSDSSQFDKSDFPTNYIRHIKENIGKADIILISSHKSVRDALVENGLAFVLAYPHISLKEEYLKRYRERGNMDAFVRLLEDNWNAWINEMTQQEGCKKVILQSGQYLSDVIRAVLTP